MRTVTAGGPGERTPPNIRSTRAGAPYTPAVSVHSDPMRRRRLGPIPALVALIAVLLPAGVFAAATVDGGRAGGDRQVRAAGFVQEASSPARPRAHPPGSPQW